MSTKVIDFRGGIIAECENNGESVIQAEIDLEALRQFRSQAVGLYGNPLVYSRFETYAPIYRNFDGWQKNAFIEVPLQSNAEAGTLAAESLERLYQSGVMVRPADAVAPQPAAAQRG